MIRQTNTAETGALCAYQNYKQKLLHTLARVFSSNFKTKFTPALGWKVRLMLPSSVMGWQTIDEEMSAYEATTLRKLVFVSTSIHLLSRTVN